MSEASRHRQHGSGQEPGDLVIGLPNELLASPAAKSFCTGIMRAWNDTCRKTGEAERNSTDFLIDTGHVLVRVLVALLAQIPDAKVRDRLIDRLTPAVRQFVAT